MERELCEPVALCDAAGRLNPEAVGWSRRPLHDCTLHGHRLRKKRWNYWCVTTPDFLFSATLSNLDYLGLGFVYFLDFHTRRYIEQTVTLPLGRGCLLGDTVEAAARLDDRRMALHFRPQPDGVALSAATHGLAPAALEAEISVQTPPAHETLNVVIPWNSRRFQFTSKQNCLPAAGEVRVGGESYPLPAGRSFACLDFGRGVWPYRSTWNWASFSTAECGVNLGAKWTDGTGMTENGLLAGGRLHKLGEDMRFDYNPANFMLPWTLRSEGSDAVDLTFTPFYERIARTEAVILGSVVHQLIGRYAGVLRPAGGAPVAVDGAIGWAEEHRARW